MPVFEKKKSIKCPKSLHQETGRSAKKKKTQSRRKEIKIGAKVRLIEKQTIEKMNKGKVRFHKRLTKLINTYSQHQK